MTLFELEEIRKQKGYTYQQISELLEVPEETVEKILCGKIRFSEYQLLRDIENVLNPSTMPECIKESSPIYAKKQGTYTLDDYYSFPDELRVELIDGVIYDMTAPRPSHQLMIGSLHYKIKDYLDKKNGKCTVFLSPIDVQLDCDDDTMVEPDLVLLCDMKKCTDRCIVGAPDFLVEVLSKSTRKKDCTVKLGKYKRAGVREYWMIDLDKEKVIVYYFDKSDEPTIYGFDNIVPVGIYQGDLVIDFNQIKTEVIR